MGEMFSCGLAAGVVATVTTHPADVVKTSLQLSPSHYRYRTREAIISIYRTLGMRGFLSGLMPRLLRRSLVSALSWTVYDRVKKHFSVKPHLKTVTNSFNVSPGHAVRSKRLKLGEFLGLLVNWVQKLI